MKTKKLHSAIIGGLLAVPLSLTYTTDAEALVVGFDPTGTGTYTNFANIWTDITDSGLDIGPIPSEAAVGLGRVFTNQLRVSEFTNNGVVTTPLGLNQENPEAGEAYENRFELTKEIKFDYILSSFLPSGTPNPFPQTAVFSIGDLSGGDPEMTIYFDPYADGSVANPNVVKCYGSGSGSAECNGASDGIKILELDLIGGQSSFTAQSAVRGTGSFDLTFAATFVDSDYLDIDIDNFIAGVGITGTLNFPSIFNPAHMWDGTPSADGLLFKVDSSEVFFNTPVPEPSTLALLGLGILGFGMKKRTSV